MADLITLDQYKAFEGITSDTKDDELSPIISSVSDLVKTYCNSNIIDNSGSPGITDVFTIEYSTHSVQLTDSPIINVILVEERGSQSESYTTLLNDGTNGKYEWYLDTVTDSIFKTNEYGTYVNWCKGVGSVRVTYTSGYLTTPLALQLAVVDTVNYFLNDEHKERYALAGASVENPGTTTIDNTASFPDHIKRVLDLYRI